MVSLDISAVDRTDISAGKSSITRGLSLLVDDNQDGKPGRLMAGEYRVIRRGGKAMPGADALGFYQAGKARPAGYLMCHGGCT